MNRAFLALLIVFSLIPVTDKRNGFEFPYHMVKQDCWWHTIKHEVHVHKSKDGDLSFF